MEIIAFLLFYAIIFALVISKKDKERSKIENVFKEFSEKYKPKQKIDTIFDLFFDCVKYTVSSLDLQTNIRAGIFSTELALHIFCLFLANKYSDIKDMSLKEFLNQQNIKLYLIIIKERLNTAIKEILKRKILNDENIEFIIASRINQIFIDKDMENRNFNFLNVCNLEIKSEEEFLYICGRFNELPIQFSDNPIDLIFLPKAYSEKLVDKYLEKLEKTY